MREVYAVIADRDVLAAMAGIAEPPYAGVCIVDGNSAECHMADGPARVEALVRGVPCCPYREGNPVALPGIDAEMEALGLLAEEALRAAASAGLPQGFVPASPRMEGGLRARLTEFGLDLAVSAELARRLGWKEGDGLSLGASRDGLVAVARGGGGAFLASTMDAPGELRLDRDLSGLPLWMPLVPSGWSSPEYCVSGGAIVLSRESLASVPDEPRPAADGGRLPPPDDGGERPAGNGRGFGGLSGMLRLAFGRGRRAPAL